MSILDSYQRNKQSLSGSSKISGSLSGGSAYDSYQRNKTQIIGQPQRQFQQVSTPDPQKSNLIRKVKSAFTPSKPLSPVPDELIAKPEDKGLTSFLKKARDEITKAISEFQLVKPAYAPSEERSTGQFLDTNQVIENKPIEDLAKEWLLTPQYNISRKTNIFTGNLFEGLTGGIVKPELEAPADLTEKIVANIGQTIGQVGALSKIGTGVETILTKTGAIASFINKYPRLAKWAVPFLKTATAFDIYGQLDPDIEDRFKKLAQDTIKAVPFTLMGAIPKARYSVPASFGLGFTMAKLSGADNEDAFISGSIFAILDGTGRIGRGGNINKKVADKIIKKQSLEVLSETSGIKLGPKSTKAEIRKAYLEAVKKHHPDKGGDVNVFKQAVSAYEFLTGKNIAPQFVEGAEAKPTNEEAVPTKEIEPVKPATETKTVNRGIFSVEDAKKFTSSKDLADAMFGAKPDNQIGNVDANKITPRDPVDVNSKEYLALKKDISENGFKDPVRVTVEDNGEIITTEGSNRVTIARELGRPVPVIVNKGIIEGLPTIDKIFTALSKEKAKEAKPTTPPDTTPPPVKKTTPPEVKKTDPIVGEGIEELSKESKILRGTKGLTAEDIMKTYPNIKLKRDVPAKDIYGNKVEIPEGEALTPYELKGNKILLQDGETYIVSKNQFQNIEGQSIGGKAKPFAPELKGTKETIKRDSKNEMSKSEAKKALKDNKEVYGIDDNGIDSLIESEDQLDNFSSFSLDEDFTPGSTPTKFSSYTLPGGKNYREILIQAPLETIDIIATKNTSPALSDNLYFLTDNEGNKLGSFNAISGSDAIEQYHRKQGFKSSHWEEKNVIAHLRMNDRTYKGKKLSFLEEIQSDWAKEGRDKGFAVEGDAVMLIEINEYLNTKNKELGKKLKKDFPEWKEQYEKFDDFLRNRKSLLADSDAVPSNQLLKNWQELAIKKSLQEAVNTNSQYMAWINGEQTTARYNLATYLEDVKWKKSPDSNLKGIKEITMKAKEGTTLRLEVDKNGEIKNTALGADSSWIGKKLDEVLGKGLADKIMEKKTGNLSGEGLSFGGEWATNLYDKQVKNIVKDLTGAKVETIDLGLAVSPSKTKFIKQSGRDSGGSLNISDLKVGLEINEEEQGDFIITEVLKDGKFKAIKSQIVQNRFNDVNVDLNKTGWSIDEFRKKLPTSFKNSEVIFDLSSKKTTQQGIKLTPEVVDKIKGIAPKIETSGNKFEKELVTKPKKSLSLKQATNKLNEYYGEADEEALGKAWYETMSLLEVAEGGRRIFDDYGEFKGSVSSTFPSFVPDNLRSRKLFDSVLGGLTDPTNIQYPPNSQPRKQELFDAILAEIDSNAGLDSSDIINSIKEAYERKPKKQTKKNQKKIKKSTSKSIKGSKTKEVNSVNVALASKGAEKLHNFELRKPPEPGTEEFKLHKKITDLIRKYASTIGEGYTPRNALGVFYRSTKNIRVNAINNLSVASHEITHFLDDSLKIVHDFQVNYKGPLRKQMKEIYQQYYPGARPDHQLRLQMTEGYATLLQKYVEMPTTIEKSYPDLVKEFLKPRGKFYKPVIGEIIKDLNKIVEDYQGLSALDKIGARVTSDNTGIDNKSFLNFFQKVRTELADKVYPIEVLSEKAGIEMSTKDPSLWLRAYNAVSGIVNNNISTDRGYWGFTDLQEGWQKKHDNNWKSLVDSLQQRKLADSFGYYLVARREHFLYEELDVMKDKRDVFKKIADPVLKLTEETLKDLDRDIKASLSEDYGIDVTELNLEKIQKQVENTLNKMNKEIEDFAEVLDKDGMSREDVDQAWEENKEMYKDEETLYDTLVNEDLKLLVNPEVQLIKKSVYAKLTAKKGYASFKRQFYDEIVGEGELQQSVKVGKTKVSSLIRRTGSERTIINPLYSAMANHSEIVKKAMKQVVYNQMGNLGASALLPNLFQEVQVKAVVDKRTGAISFPQEKDPNIIMYRKDYKRKAVLVNREVKQTVDMLLTYQNVDIFSQVYTMMSRTFTAGTTGLYPPFAITNIFRDQLTAMVNSYRKYKPLWSPMKEMTKALSKKGGVEAKYYKEYIVMAGERQTLTGWQRLSPKDMFKRVSSEKKAMQKAIDQVQKGVDLLSLPSAKSEIFSRATEYIKARKAGKSQIVALEEAGRVTAPFHHTGKWGAKPGSNVGQIYVKGLPFFNASIQVIDQTLRVANTKEGRKRITFLTIALLASYLASLTAILRATDDQKNQYKDLEAEDLVNFIYFPNPSGQGLTRLPVTNTFSAPATLINMIIANRVMDTKYKASDAIDAVTAFLPDQFNLTDPVNAILAWIPQVINPVTHTIFNVKTYPSVRAMVSPGLANKPPELQYNEGTSAFSKKMGELLNISPIKLDYLLTGYLGRSIGFLTVKPNIYNPFTSVVRDYWFTNGRNVRQFYETREENNANYSAYQNKEGSFEKLSKEEANEIYRRKQITNEIDKLLSDYSEIDIENDQEKASKMRAEILLHITRLEDGTKMKGFSSWASDAKKRRNKIK